MMIPRIQGKVGQAEDGPHLGKWYFEITITELGGGSEGHTYSPIGPYESEEAALKELRRACQMACEVAEKEACGEISGKYIDMKDNLTKKWDRSDQH